MKSLLYNVFQACNDVTPHLCSGYTSVLMSTYEKLAQNWLWDMHTFKQASTLPTNRLFACMTISVKMSCRGSMRKIVLFEALHMPGLLKSLCSSLQKQISRCFHCFCMIYLSINVFVPPPFDWLRHLGLCGALRYLLEKKLMNFLLTIFCFPSPWLWHFQLQHNVATIPCGEIYAKRHHGNSYSEYGLQLATLKCTSFSDQFLLLM